MKIISFIFGWWVFKPYSLFIKLILNLKGLRVGNDFYIQGIPFLKIRGKASNIKFSNNVSINGDIDIRNRENGKIYVCNNVSLDTNLRFVAANNAILHIGSGSKLGAYSFFNCGDDIKIGENCIFGGYCIFQSSNHGIKSGEIIKYQKHTYGKIFIGNGVWLGAHVIVLAGVTIGEGAVIGANSVVTKDIPPNSIAVGSPAKVISFRV